MARSAIHRGVYVSVKPLEQAACASPKAPWLLTPYEFHVWSVTDTGNRPRVVIDFNIRLQDGRVLADASPHLYAQIKKLTFVVRNGATAEVDSGKVQAECAKALLTLARWMLPRGLHYFDDLHPDHIIEYADLAAYGVYAIRNVEGALRERIDEFTSVVLPNDPPVVAAKKLQEVLPTLGIVKKRLDERRLLSEAGLGDVKVSAGIAGQLNELCAQAGLPPLRLCSSGDSDDEPVSQQHIGRLLKPFDLLHRHRHLIGDGIAFDPFPGSSVGEEAAIRGKEAGRTATMPPQTAMALIDVSLRWVLDYAPGLLHLKEMADNSFDRTGVPTAELAEVDLINLTYRGPLVACPFPISPVLSSLLRYESASEAGDSKSGMSLYVALRHLATACATVIAAFSARRAAEIGGLKVGCIAFTAHKPWLSTFVHKTLQRYASIPVSRCVAAAVQVLEQLSERARALTDSPYILQMNLPGTATTIWLLDGLPSFPFGKCLAKFGEFAALPNADDGNNWTFKPHQFRRYFAIIYVWVYELGDFGALSYHLRHFDINMTRRYLTEKEVGEIIRWAQKERNAATLARAGMGDNAPSATANGHSLQDYLAVRMQVVAEQRAESRFARISARGNIKLRAAEFGFAGSATGDATKSNAPRLSRYVPIEALSGTADLHKRFAGSDSPALKESAKAWLAELERITAERRSHEECV